MGGSLSTNEDVRRRFAMHALDEVSLRLDDRTACGTDVLREELGAADVLLLDDADKVAAGARVPFADFALGLRALAHDLSVPVVATAGLPFDPPADHGFPPTLGEIPGAEGTVRVADVVLLLHEESWYMTSEEIALHDSYGEVEISVARNAHRPLGSARVHRTRRKMWMG